MARRLLRYVLKFQYVLVMILRWIRVDWLILNNSNYQSAYLTGVALNMPFSEKDRYQYAIDEIMHRYEMYFRFYFSIIELLQSNLSFGNSWFM